MRKATAEKTDNSTKLAGDNMRKNKLFVCTCIVAALITLFAVCAAGCTGKEEVISNLGNNFKPYDESAFIEQMATAGEGRIGFAKDGQAQFDVIVYPDGLFEGESEDREICELEGAVSFLQETLRKVTGAEYRIVSENSYDGAQKAIVLQVDKDCAVEKGAFRLAVKSDSILLQSSDKEGLCCGIYAFLEEKLGCMFVSPEYDYIPSLPTVYLDEEDKVYAPSVKWRYVYSDEADVPKNDEGKRAVYGNYWYSKLRLNGAGTKDWYAWVHTSFTYVSPQEYFDEHPEYFSLYMGKRTYQQGPVSGQLCWTNEDVYRIISQKVLQEMRENPDIHIWDVSQMDTWESRGKGCACAECKAIDDREGSQMGSLLTFINRLAEEVKKEFPDNYISTLAYNYSDTPPKNIRPADNVIIKLCLMPGDCASSYADPDGKYSQKVNSLVEAWGDVAQNIVIWDYNIDFHNYLMPFPILDNLKENNEFYVENNVYGMFRQMSADKGGDSVEINSYLLARLMWDKDADVQQLFDKYLTVYYKDAAPYIAKYYGLISENLQKSGDELYIYAKPYQYMSSYLSPSAIDDYLGIFEQAENAVKDDEVLISRVRYAKRSVLFAKAVQFSGDNEGRKKALSEFVDICNENGVTSLIEGEQNGDELAVFYNKIKMQTDAFPAIVIAMILGALLVSAAIASLVLSIVCKVKYKTFNFVKLYKQKKKQKLQQTE